MINPPSIGATTSYATPWALVRRGGSAPGLRPATRIAFITRALAKDNRITGFKMLLWSSRMMKWTKVRDLDPAAVVKTWRQRPSAAAIRRAKASLPREASHDHA